MQYLIPLIALLFSLLTHVAANHYTCNWGGPDPDPEKASFAKFCEAGQNYVNKKRVTFRCDGPREVRVADWGYLGDGLLEFGTPCNGGGYALTSQCKNNASFWAVCIVPVGKTTKECKYLWRYDDCQWPETFTRDTLPKKVIIYYK